MVEFNTPMKLLMFIVVLLIMVLGIFVFLASILYCYMLQKFYIHGQPLLNRPEGRTLYASVISMMICLAAAACTNNRSVHSVTFLFFFAISGIVALSHVQKIRHAAELYYLSPEGQLVANNMTLGKMQLTQTFRGITTSAVVVALIVWVFGMMVAVAYNGDYSRMQEDVGKKFNVGGYY